MRLHLLLPQVKPGALTPPTSCPTPDCPGSTFRLHQQVRKAVRDTRYAHVPAARYQCLTCHHTFRVYPLGVTAAHTSQRVRGLGVMFYLLGLSYGATALALEALGVPLAKSTIYEAMQAAAAGLPDLRQDAVFAGLRTPALGADLTSVLCNGEWLTLGLTVDAVSGLTLTIDVLEGSDAATIQAWLAPIVAAVGAELLVTDDADSMKAAADGLGLTHQVCKAHVRRNTEALVAELTAKVMGDPDGSLAAIGVPVEQAQADLWRLGEVVRERQPQQAYEVDVIHQRYKDAAPPGKGAKWSLAYRLRQLFLDRAQLWSRLTRYRTWEGPDGETIDGTNNASERGIGWWIKERYRTMRGYKQPASAVNVSRLVAWAGNALGGPAADLAQVLA